MWNAAASAPLEAGSTVDANGVSDTTSIATHTRERHRRTQDAA